MAGRCDPLKRSYRSAPATRVSSPENIRKFRCAEELQRHLAEVRRKSKPGEYARVAVSEPEPAPGHDQGPLVTPQCLLFFVTTSLLFLSMAVMMIVVILHFATAGKLFASRTPRRNTSAPQEHPPFNFIHGGVTAKAR